MSKLSHLSVLALGGLLALAPVLDARPCTGNGDIAGAYGWTASRSPVFVPVAVDPPATTIVRSITPIGALAGGAANALAFAAVGRVYLDGSGGIFSSSSATTPVLQVGTYSVNLDCTISASIIDAFMPPQEFFFGPAQASATFQGVVVQSGTEISLAQTSGIGGTTIELQKMKQYGGCAEDALTGSFGFSASGVSSILGADNTLSTTPFVLAGRFVGDGTGKFVNDALADQSPLKPRQFTGVYSVSGDCTGAGTLIDSNGKSRKISLVVVNSAAGSAGAAGVFFAFTDTTVGSGVAVQQ
jgi:hypothetical protein